MTTLKKIYFDGAANTPMDERAFECAKPFLINNFAGNSFALHEDGIAAAVAIEEARTKIGETLGVNPEQIIFTSGATEGNNWIIRNFAYWLEQHPEAPRRTILISAYEHSSIFNTAKSVVSNNVKVETIQDLEKGEKGLAFLEYKLKTNEIGLVCIMSINNETGSMFDINTVAALCNYYHVPFLCDCTQLIGAGYTIKDLNLRNSHINFITFSGHKIYGPTGVGCLIANNPKVIPPFIIGGAQEQGLRGGTSNTYAIVAMGEAIRLNSNSQTISHFNNLYDHFLQKLRGKQDQDHNYPLKLNSVGHFVQFASNIISLRLDCLPNNQNFADLLINRGIECSAGSACDSNSGGVEDAKPSHVLAAFGLTLVEIRHTARISFTKYTTISDIDSLFEVIDDIIKDYKGDSNEKEN